MAKLVINQLIIIAENEKKANRFQFGAGKNLITSDLNTVGKSTLVKMLLWSFGCKPSLDSDWLKLGLKTVVEFSVGRTDYKILRQDNQMSVKKGHSSWRVFPKITGDYSKLLGDILHFTPIFKLKKSDNHMVSTPDGYFMAYYLDQQCWQGAWKSLRGLDGFDKYKTNLIKAHSGLLTKEYFECQNEELNAQEERKNEEEVLNKYDDAVRLIHDDCLPSGSLFTVDTSIFNSQRVILQDKLLQLQKKQSNLWSKLAKLYNDKHCLAIQIPVIEKNIKELKKDYDFSLTLDHVVNCPICNTRISNDVVYRASILSDKESSEEQLSEVMSKLADLNKAIEDLQPEYNSITAEIDDIANKFIVEDQEGNRLTTIDYISQIGEKTVVDKLSANRNAQEQKVLLVNSRIKELSKEMKKISQSIDKEAINSFFMNMLKEVDEVLELDYGLVREKVKSPIDYKKICQGGAADITRSVLSYYSALYLLIRNQQNEIVGPLIVDTPQQQGQSDDNEVNIMNLINKKLYDSRNEYQVFLCAKNEGVLDDYKNNAVVFDLQKNRGLLDASMYEECVESFSNYQSI